MIRANMGVAEPKIDLCSCEGLCITAPRIATRYSLKSEGTCELAMQLFLSNELIFHLSYV